MNETLKLCIAVLIKNVLVVALFVLLAIKFQHWWRVLFSVLFWNSISTSNKDEEEESKNADTRND